MCVRLQALVYGILPPRKEAPESDAQCVCVILSTGLRHASSKEGGAGKRCSECVCVRARVCVKIPRGCLRVSLTLCLQKNLCC